MSDAATPEQVALVGVLVRGLGTGAAVREMPATRAEASALIFSLLDAASTP